MVKNSDRKKVYELDRGIRKVLTGPNKAERYLAKIEVLEKENKELRADKVKLVDQIEESTRKELTDGLENLLQIGTLTSSNSWASSVGYIVDAISKLYKEEDTPERQFKLKLCTFAASIQCLEVVLMISFFFVTCRNINKKKARLSNRVFKFIKWNIYIGDILLEWIGTGIFLYLVWHLDYETIPGFMICVYSTLMNQIAACFEIRMATQLDKFTKS